MKEEKNTSKLGILIMAAGATLFIGSVIYAILNPELIAVMSTIRLFAIAAVLIGLVLINQVDVHKIDEPERKQIEKMKIAVWVILTAMIVAFLTMTLFFMPSN